MTNDATPTRGQWEDTNAGAVYRNADGINASIWPAFHGGAHWYVRADATDRGRGSAPTRDAALAAATRVIRAVEANV